MSVFCLFRNHPSGTLDAEEYEEIRLVQNQVENWRSTDEPDFQMTEPRIRRSLSPSPGDGHPIAKRARLDGLQSKDTAAQDDAAVPLHASAGPSALPASRGLGDVDQPAAKAFFGLPELLSLLCTHLAYDKVDLVVLSRVSRRVRAVVLPTLYQTLNVRLTKVALLSRVFKANPGLIEQVRYLRVVDDAARYHARCNTIGNSTLPAAFHSQDEPRLSAATWTSLGDFLLAVQNRRNFSKPRVELSFGQMSLIELYNELRRAPRVLETLTALFIMDDFGMAHFKYLDRKAVENTYHDHGTAISEELTAVLRLICDVQDDADVDNFQTFEFKALRLKTEERGSLLPMLPPRLLKRLGGRIRSLFVSIGEGIRSDAESFKVLTEANWWKLRNFRVHCGCCSEEVYASIQSVVTNFLRRHMHLVETDIRIEEDRWGEGGPHWVNVSLPRLVACHLQPTHVSTELQLDFANAHQDIRKLWVTGFNGAFALASHRAIIKSLRFLRAEPGVAEEFLDAGAAISHLHVDLIADDEGYCRFPECLYPGGQPTTSITSFVLQFEEIAFTHIIQKPETYLPIHRLPNLVEFSLKWTSGAVSKVRDSPEQSAQCLAALLNELAKHGAKLRAVRIDYEAAADLPSDNNLAQAVKTFPPKLEYLVWHIPCINRTDHYRVLRPQANSPPSSAQVAQSSRSRPGQITSSTQTSETQPKVRLQRLPAIFRPKVDPKTGMWEDLDDEGCLSLFDHMGREPRLKFM
ncbi:unnamed protein product [Tilletia caries]|nr:unnamed protein product [Tilletia caries]